MIDSFDLSSARSTFEHDGFIFVPHLFSHETLDKLETSIVRIARKYLGLESVELPDSVRRSADGRVLFRFMEHARPDLFYKLNLHAGTSLEAMAVVAGTAVRSVLNAIVPAHQQPLFPQPLAFFYNHRSAPRLQYDWHQESSSFVDIENGYHLWFPLFGDIQSENGPMLLARGSHKERLPFKVHAKAGHLTQWRLNRDIGKDFEIVECNMPRGHAVIFHHNTVHCTGENSAGLPRVSGIVRYLDCMTAAAFRPLVEFTYTAHSHEQEQARLSATNEDG